MDDELSKTKLSHTGPSQVDEFRHLTIEEICQEAGCARSTFYSHFESKEELLEEIIDEQMAKIERLIARRFDNQLTLSVSGRLRD